MTYLVYIDDKQGDWSLFELTPIVIQEINETKQDIKDYAKKVLIPEKAKRLYNEQFELHKGEEYENDEEYQCILNSLNAFVMQLPDTFITIK